jgi:hypothetical protein
MSKGKRMERGEKGELIRDSMKNLEYLKDNYERLKKDYDKKWVVIDKGGIVNSSSSYDEILKTKAANKKTALFEFIDSEQIAMFF